ncbi:MAG: hypothetical protein HOH19_15255 [Kordiimonadaceae bacterium]|jgi:hypothetical protein|nr:hypothetical protein [Kordiimonadaceae bacterium]MBT6033928.1 hypothetical protein [Kordiimonadaceae bacterium]
MIYLSLFLLLITFTAVPGIPLLFGIEEIRDETFFVTIRFFIRAYFVIYFAVFAIPKAWKSEMPDKKRYIWTIAYSLGFLFFASNLLDFTIDPEFQSRAFPDSP